VEAFEFDTDRIHSFFWDLFFNFLHLALADLLPQWLWARPATWGRRPNLLYVFSLVTPFWCRTSSLLLFFFHHNHFPYFCCDFSFPLLSLCPKHPFFQVPCFPFLPNSGISAAREPTSSFLSRSALPRRTPLQFTSTFPTVPVIFLSFASLRPFRPARVRRRSLLFQKV